MSVLLIRKMYGQKRTHTGKVLKYSRAAIYRNPTWKSGFRTTRAVGHRSHHTVRKFMLQSKAFTTDPVTSAIESPYGNSGQFKGAGMDFALRDFLDSGSGLLTTFDQYRFKKIDLYVTTQIIDRPDSNKSFGPIICYTSVDYDDTFTPTWGTMSQRQNTNQAALRSSYPMIKVASWKPKANYISQAGDAPGNLVPKHGEWFDTSQPTQGFNGIKAMIFCNTQQTVHYFAKATIEFKGAI